MTNNIDDFNTALEKLRLAKEAYMQYREAYRDFFDFLSMHVEKSLFEYKAPIRYSPSGSRDLDDVCHAFITGHPEVENQYKQLEYAVKAAMDVKDFE